MSQPSNDLLPEREIARRREAALKRMLATPPTPHADSKVSRKRKAKKKAKPRRKK